MIKIDKTIAEQITWEQDPDNFDRRLHALGQGLDEFIIVNPKYDPWILNYIDPSELDSDKCIVWAIDNLWLVKKFKKSWTEADGWDLVHCELDIEKKVEFNEDVKYLNAELREQINNFKIGIEELYTEHVWYVDPALVETTDKIWLARVTAVDVEITDYKDMGYLSPVLVFNSDLPKIDYDVNLNLPFYHHDYNYELVWHLDNRLNHDVIDQYDEENKIWLAKFIPDLKTGYKEMPAAAPVIEYNPDVPAVRYNINLNMPYQDLVYEHVWYLDEKFNPMAGDVWVARICPRKSIGVKNMGYVKPVFEINPDFPSIDFDFNFDLPYYDFDYNYELTWYLNPKFSAGIDRVWAIRLKPEVSQGVKDMGYVSPRIIFNPDVPKLNYYITDEIPYYDLNYEHVWMLPDDLHTDVEKIWAAKIVPAAQSAGVKQMGYIGVALDKFDVVFISYNEPNAEANWQRVLEICPTAKRVKNVKGIFEAHKAAAELAETDMFYVVDGDAELVDNWKFDYRPNVFNLDCVHLWTSINPINDLEYGWGGVKLFPRKLLLDATTWKVDLTTGLGKLIYLNKISNVNTFNTGPFNTWRSAFRECAKLSAKLQQGFGTSHEQEDAEYRLKTWNTVGQDRPYGDYAIEGAKQGTEFGAKHFSDLDTLKLINDYDWMKHEFNEFYKHQ